MSLPPWSVCKSVGWPGSCLGPAAFYHSSVLCKAKLATVTSVCILRTDYPLTDLQLSPRFHSSVAAPSLLPLPPSPSSSSPSPPPSPPLFLLEGSDLVLFLCFRLTGKILNRFVCHPLLPQVFIIGSSTLDYQSQNIIIHIDFGPSGQLSHDACGCPKI